MSLKMKIAMCRGGSCSYPQDIITIYNYNYNSNNTNNDNDKDNVNDDDDNDEDDDDDNQPYYLRVTQQS